jgi:aminoglycoside 6'-N-acetyltransferase
MRAMNFDPAKLAFRAMTSDDVPQLRRWLAEPHVARWFKPDHGDSLAEAAADASSAIHPFIVSHAAHPIGMIAWECLADFPDAMDLYGVTDAHAINCDVFIGDPAYVGHGLGGPVVKRFLAALKTKEPQWTTCIIDPMVDNTSAIRAYAKVGFRWVRNAPDGEGEEVHLMELSIA